MSVNRLRDKEALDELSLYFAAAREEQVPLPGRLREAILEDAYRIQSEWPNQDQLGRNKETEYAGIRLVPRIWARRLTLLFAASAASGLGLGYASAESIELFTYGVLGLLEPTQTMDAYGSVTEWIGGE